jgi:primosomal protein N' (replication factor Y)
LIATVAVAAPLDKALSYLVPEALREQARVGVRLRVPLGRRSAVGYLLGLAAGEPAGLKEIKEVLDAAPLFPPELVPFFVRAADYYAHPLGEVIRTALPAVVCPEA